MKIHRATRSSAAVFVAVLAVLAFAAVGSVGDAATARPSDGGRPAGIVWVGNRGFPAVAAFDASSRERLMTVTLDAPASDVAVGRFGKVFVGEENASTIAVIDTDSGRVIRHIPTATRPHHLEASRNGRWVTYGAYGTNRVGVIDARSGRLVGEWRASDSPEARSHASVITPDGRTVYVANDSTNEVTAIDVRSGALLFSIEVHHAHELVLTRDQGTLYVVGRMVNMLNVVDLPSKTVTRMLEVGPMPDTLQLVDDDRLLTIGLRGSPAQILLVRTDPLEIVGGGPVTIAGPGTTAGHQWTSPNGHWTIAAFEGGPTPGFAVINHRTGAIVTDEFPTMDEFPGLPSRPHGLDVDR
jgi:DNA-binding beta-propeller fold protein YncE